MAQFEINWEAPEFEYHEKDVSWYWISILVAALIIAFSVWERNFLFGFFIVVAEMLVITWGNRVPPMIDFTLDENHLIIGEHKIYSLKEFESWSTTALDDESSEIMFNFRAKFKIPVKALVPTTKIEDIRKNLKLILREVEHQTSLLDAIEKLLRF